MLIKSEFVLSHHQRISKLGKVHSYTRKKSVLTFRCDCCGSMFQRERGMMDPTRLNNNFYHVCHLCDVKRFAQMKGVESRHIWDMPVSSLKTIAQL